MLLQFFWKYIKNKLPLEKLSNIIEQSKLVGLVDWSNLIHCSKIWEGILEEIMPKLNDKHKYFFFDLADPSKKSIEEILAVIGKYAQYRKVKVRISNNLLIIWRSCMISPNFFLLFLTVS